MQNLDLKKIDMNVKGGLFGWGSHGEQGGRKAK
jgi:hypothetical protein